MTFAVQYLERYDALVHTPAAVRRRLQEACQRLPIAIVITGWELPAEIGAACAEEAARQGARHYRWHPLLSASSQFAIRPEWQTIGLQGEAIGGFDGRPEFTFACPNHPDAQAAVLHHLEIALSSGMYQGVFLDRIRYPSPTADPLRSLGCFCAHCRRLAAEAGIDWVAVRAALQADSPQASVEVARTLLSKGNPSDRKSLALEAFLHFRQDSITRMVKHAARIAHQMGLSVGLDVFSPCLARMVGQDLASLDACSDWVKPMSYAHTLAPAGLPFELLRLANWMIEVGVAQTTALACLRRATGLPLPSRRAALCVNGLSPAALEAETRRARQAVRQPLLAGVALVEMPAVNHLPADRLSDEIAAYRLGGAEGLVIAWDLWRIPLERLGQVKMAWDEDWKSAVQVNRDDEAL